MEAFEPYQPDRKPMYAKGCHCECELFSPYTEWKVNKGSGDLASANTTPPCWWTRDDVRRHGVAADLTNCLHSLGPICGGPDMPCGTLHTCIQRSLRIDFIPSHIQWRGRVPHGFTCFSFSSSLFQKGSGTISNSAIAHPNSTTWYSGWVLGGRAGGDATYYHNVSYEPHIIIM